MKECTVSGLICCYTGCDLTTCPPETMCCDGSGRLLTCDCESCIMAGKEQYPVGMVKKDDQICRLSLPCCQSGLFKPDPSNLIACDFKLLCLRLVGQLPFGNAVPEPICSSARHPNAAYLLRLACSRVHASHRQPRAPSRALVRRSLGHPVRDEGREARLRLVHHAVHARLRPVRGGLCARHRLHAAGLRAQPDGGDVRYRIAQRKRAHMRMRVHACAAQMCARLASLRYEGGTTARLARALKGRKARRSPLRRKHGSARVGAEDLDSRERVGTPRGVVLIRERTA